MFLSFFLKKKTILYVSNLELPLLKLKTIYIEVFSSFCLAMWDNPSSNDFFFIDIA